MITDNGKIFAPKYNALKVTNNITTMADIIYPDMLHLVDPYWLQFPPVPQLWNGIIALALCSIGLMSSVGNFMVIYIFLSTKALRTPSNLFVVNLAISDFMLMFTMCPLVIINLYHGTWIFGPLVCEIYGMFGSLFGCSSIWSMTLIAIDRYNVIVKGISGKPLTISGAIGQILIVWILSAIWTVVPLFGWNRYVPEGNMTACGTDYFAETIWDKSYIWIYGIWVYIVPLGAIIFSYYHILIAVSHHEKAMREQAKKMNVDSLRSGDDKNKSVEIKLAKVALCTISLWFMAWTPYTILNIAGILGFRQFTPLSTIWGSVFAKANSFYNPIVYAISHPKYKAALHSKFPRLSCKQAETTTDAQSANTSVDKTSAI